MTAQAKAIEQVDTLDAARASFVRQYLGLKWPDAEHFHAMLNTDSGDVVTAGMLLACLEQFEGSSGGAMPIRPAG
jgi:hypothetical protein